MMLTACSMSKSEGAQPAGSGDASSVPSAPPTSLKYVALGDSYVAAPLVPVTDVANGCFRSSSNYPSIVAKKLGAHLDDRSCGGARSADFTRSQYPDVPPQLTAIEPGVDLVTIGIGGNDESVFARLVGKCPALRASDPEGAPCRAFMSSKGPDALLTALDRTESRVTKLVREVRDQLPDAQVLVVGYPQIVSPDDACPELPLARGDYAYAEQVNLALTTMLRKVGSATGSTYVDVWSASKGHDICSDDPWINGSVNNEKQAARYHPFANEQAAVADLVVKAVRASTDRSRVERDWYRCTMRRGRPCGDRGRHD
jgi:lysophospholipase L1-like esterase